MKVRVERGEEGKRKEEGGEWGGKTRWQVRQTKHHIKYQQERPSQLLHGQPCHFALPALPQVQTLDSSGQYRAM